MRTLRDWYTAGRLKLFPHWARRLELAEAYQRVLVSGNASAEECRLVLRDMIRRAGFLDVDAELTGEDALLRCGRRALMAETLQILRWSEAELVQLGEEMTWDQVVAHQAQRMEDAA